MLDTAWKKLGNENIIISYNIKVFSVDKEVHI